MIGQASNPLLEKAEQALLAKVPANLQKTVAQVVHAGLSVLYSAKIAPQLQKRIAGITDPAKEAGEGAARMMSNLYQQSGKTMPLKGVAVPASQILALEFLDLCAKAGKANITPQLVGQTAQATADAMMPFFGVTKPMLSKAMALAQQKQDGTLPAAPGGLVDQAQAGA